MRIVAGKHRGRPIAAPDSHDIRPTSDRVREAMFNILEHRDWGAGGLSLISNARVLDAFSGTGALGLEALSRGAVHVTFMDNNRAALDLCRRNLADLEELAAANVLQGNCIKPVRPTSACDLVFLDPPYHSGLAVAGIVALRRVGWIAPGAICVLETGAKENPEIPDDFTVLDERKYGAAKVRFLRCGNTVPATDQRV